VLALATSQPFARGLVNSGRLSVPATLHDSVLNTPDIDPFAGRMVPGAPAVDAPLVRADGRRTWLLRELGGGGFSLLAFGLSADRLAALREAAGRIADLDLVAVGPGADLADEQGLLAQRYDLQPGSAYLLRPDQHVCARWRTPSPALLRNALLRATGRP